MMPETGLPTAQTFAPVRYPENRTVVLKVTLFVLWSVGAAR
ncbi:hypothetical protein TRICHSKD4_5560 [Roseibium sp. TrichSKD4]|nr:hypothetical protein TRICHSKD4_5560 [Roseibium sp. TrichSKD4]